MRKSMAVLATLIVVGGVTGASEVGLHGLKFFLFRNTGAGAGNSQDLEENQGPGQANAPGAHHDPVNPPAKGKHHKKGHHGKQQSIKSQQGNGNGGNGNGGNGNGQRQQRRQRQRPEQRQRRQRQLSRCAGGPPARGSEPRNLKENPDGHDGCRARLSARGG